MKSPLFKPLGSSLLIVVLSAGLASGCRAQTTLPDAGNGGTNTPVAQVDAPDKPKDAPDKPAGIRANPFFVVTSAKSPEYAVGEPIEMQIEITNNSNEKAQLQFTSGQKFDFFVRHEGSENTIWSWGMNKRFAQMLSSEFIEPGKSIIYEAKWAAKEPGNYVISGLVTANGGLKASPFRVIVK